MLRFARAGWDVIKVQRNPTHERGWIPSGVRHVADVVARAEKAKAEGYRQVIAAGQSYGGAISIEASGKTKAIDGVIALPLVTAAMPRAMPDCVSSMDSPIS